MITLTLSGAEACAVEHALDRVVSSHPPIGSAIHRRRLEDVKARLIGEIEGDTDA